MPEIDGFASDSGKRRSVCHRARKVFSSCNEATAGVE